MIIKSPRESFGRILNIFLNPFGIYWFPTREKEDWIDWAGLLAMCLLLIFIIGYCVSYTYNFFTK
jgi:hypothetical protein